MGLLIFIIGLTIIITIGIFLLALILAALILITQKIILEFADWYLSFPIK